MIAVEGTKRGVEARELPGSTAGHSITQLTAHPELESQHTYYDICPWSHDERFIVFSSARRSGRWREIGLDGLASDSGTVNLLDTATMEITQVIDQAIYLRHGGTFCMWNPLRHRFYYHATEHASVGLDLETGDTHQVPGRVRQVSPDGELFAVPMHGGRDGGQGSAVGVLDESGGEPRLLVDRARLHEMTPNRHEFPPEAMTLGNFKWHPDSEHLLIAMWVHGYPMRGHDAPACRRSLYVATRDGSEVRWLTHFGGHHSWAPDGSRVLFVDYREGEHDGTAQGRYLHTVDFDGSNRTQIFDQVAGSHPLMHPTKNLVVDFDEDTVYVVNLDTQRREVLARFRRRFDGTHKGTHPHPVWNHDGTKVLYNSAETGQCELYLIDMTR
jgi:hypothetical protein